MNAVGGPGPHETRIGGDRPRWYQVGKRLLRAKDADGWRDQCQVVDNHATPNPTPAAQTRLVIERDGAMVARSQILVTGSTATLVGTLTNETGSYVYFSGKPPYAITFEKDGSETVLLGDFSSPPREHPSCGDCVMHPGASISYRSIPVTLQNPHRRWDGTEWCAYSESTMLDMSFRSQREVPTIQLFD